MYYLCVTIYYTIMQSISKNITSIHGHGPNKSNIYLISIFLCNKLHINELSGSMSIFISIYIFACATIKKISYEQQYSSNENDCSYFPPAQHFGDNIHANLYNTMTDNNVMTGGEVAATHTLIHTRSQNTFMLYLINAID